MRRLLLASTLLVACNGDAPLRAPSPASARVSIEMAVGGQAQADRTIAIRAFYRRSEGGEVDLTVTPDRLVLQS
jgi:hypothetical protein